MSKKSIIIVGAGIGGLTLALSLRNSGHHVKIYESFLTMTPLGVGINLQPYATKILAKLGLIDELEKISVKTKEFVFFNRFGQFINAIPAGLHAGFEYPQLSIHRGKLQSILFNKVIKTLGLNSIVLGHEFKNFRIINNKVNVFFINHTNNSKDVSHDCDLLIGADGVNSQVYKNIYPNGPKLHDSGMIMWRGTSLYDKFLTGSSMVRIGLPSHGKIVIYPIENNVNASGKQRINWVIELEKKLKSHESINALKNKYIEYFSDWNFDWLNIAELIANPESEVLTMPMMDRNPLYKWNFSPVTLLGDSAHPMLPLGSNGAGQAILDANTLAAELISHPDRQLYDTLQAYEDQRLAYTTKITLCDRAGIIDNLVREVDKRSQGKPFSDLSELITPAEIDALSHPRYLMD